MKICPNYHFENFENTEYCDGCGNSIHNIRTEFFSITDFIRKNSAVYAVIGIFLAVFQYFFSSSDHNIKIISLLPLFVSIFLLFSLIFKGYHILNSQQYENSFNRFFNANSFEMWIFLSINISLIVGLIWSTGTEFILAISLLGIIVIVFIMFIQRISNTREMTVLTIWLNLIGLLFFEIGWFVFQFLLPILKTITDSTLWFWTLMSPLLLLFFGMGTVLANMFISVWIFLTGSQQSRENQNQLSLETLSQACHQYIQIFNDTILMKIVLGIIIILGIGTLFGLSETL